MGKLALAFLAFVLVAAGGVSLTLHHLNHFSAVAAADQGAGLAACMPVVGMPGVEDAATDPVSGLAWLSSLDRRERQKMSTVRGEIKAFDPDNPLDPASWRDRTGGVPADFAPLGIDVYADGQTHRLFVINAADRSVLIYTITRQGDLALIDTVRDGRLTSPNEIVAVGPKSFYVSNSTASGFDSVFSGLEFVAGLGNGSILFYDGNSWSEAARGLKFANGLAVSPDGATLYAAEMGGKLVRVYDRDPGLGTLQPERVIRLDSFPDNLTWGADGKLLVGAIPKPLQFAAHLRSDDEIAPSKLVRIDPGSGAVETLYLDDGSRLSGLTVGARIGGKFLLGSFAENKFLLCDSPVVTESR
ncbi:strictosidine synthase family protein [Aquisalinus flavus]|uniref:SMP-30/Gluconolactonase/LRE-like region domain-containing protein n=1 Tax=Aquisalinus flavus TaxID=1526572 RepID=A0A8J2V101_9PROT|nr:SMP-30/gluconolactonase/LRE family protein [Aquisalinus flavus]MBD0426991.1 SMP-30/gluconolactonase/LRE family protein [Aquisalinus flavus]UNE46823.1 hypothetical protein FF099_01500 [Aquisalinus flavus]GGC97507.1 hypothetical protein GCM10011342_03040 [Aquisalinus flavus]